MSNLALVKPEKANAVENYLIQMARFGQLGGKVRECTSDAWSTNDVVVFHMPAVQLVDFLFFLADFRVGLDRDSRKSQSANGQEDNCQGKFHWNVSYVWFIISHLSISLHLFSLLVSSTDGGLWTRMMRMITNFQTKPWNESRNPERICFTGTLIASHIS